MGKLVSVGHQRHPDGVEAIILKLRWQRENEVEKKLKALIVLPKDRVRIQKHSDRIRKNDPTQLNGGAFLNGHTLKSVIMGI